MKVFKLYGYTPEEIFLLKQTIENFNPNHSVDIEETSDGTEFWKEVVKVDED